jgi:sirohydrochlorin cobaltochelatase
MPGDIDSLLAGLLQCGSLRAGQLQLATESDGFELRHVEDAGRTELEVHHRAEDARELSLNDESGAYRPLKTAPNLRRGWCLRLGTIAEVHRALDYFYPAMLGVWRDFHAGRLQIVPLRETLGRQSGMYAVTRKITDEQAQEMIRGFCRSDTGCLKRILWEIAPGVPVTTLPPEKFKTAGADDELPLFCHESCNLLVARAREVVKGAQA